MLGEPPDPPPAEIPAFEPDTRGATSIRQQLAKHRSMASCASCHARIDPPGFALENFDVIGGWRGRYRAEKGNSAPGRFRGREIWEYRLGPTVDASGEILGGRKFHDIDDFKRLLMERKDQVARNLAQNLLTYATGAGIQFADRDAVEAILARLKSRGAACARSSTRSSRARRSRASNSETVRMIPVSSSAAPKGPDPRPGILAIDS